MMTTSTTSALSSDTQAILLLCGYFGGTQSEAPLKSSEYIRLARWLHQRKLRPADLLEVSAIELLSTLPADLKLSTDRLRNLLSRGVSLGFELERWAKQGIWVISRADADYPESIRKKLGTAAPVLLYGAGNKNLLNRTGVAIVGARDADASALNFTRLVAHRCASEQVTVISGGARGIDQEAVSATLEVGGEAVVVLAEGVAKIAVSRAYRPHLAAQRLVLVSPYGPQARWTTGNAMGRNKLVYTLSQITVVASSGLDGGTWEGATENLKAGWVPLFVHSGNNVPAGNKALMQRGGIPYTESEIASLATLLQQNEQIRNEQQAPNDDTLSNAQSSIIPVVPQDKAPLSADSTLTKAASKKQEPKKRVRKVDASNSLSIFESALPSHNDDISEQTNTIPDIVHPIIHTIQIDIFPVVWPLLANSFETQVLDTEIAAISNKYNVQVTQLRAWITRATKEGYLKKLSKPVRYQSHR